VFGSEAERAQGWCGHVVKSESCADVIEAATTCQQQQQQHVASAPSSYDVSVTSSSPIAACSPPTAAAAFNIAHHRQYCTAPTPSRPWGAGLQAFLRGAVTGKIVSVICSNMYFLTQN